MNLKEKHKKMHGKDQPATIFTNMEKSISKAKESQHPTNPIGATLKFADGSTISTSNLHIKELGAINTKIGGGSPTIHAEMALIMLAIAERKSTLGAKIYITDPPCPSCTKILIEAGIKEIYVDDKGYEKNWYKKNEQDYSNMSLIMAGQNGTPVYAVSRNKEKKRATTKMTNKKLLKKQPNLPWEKTEFKQSIPKDKADIDQLIKNTQEKFGENTRFSAMVTHVNTTNSTAQPIFIAFKESPIVTMHIKGNESNYQSKKYSFEILAMDRLIAACARHNFVPNSPVILSDYKTGSEFVDLAGLTKITRKGQTMGIDILNMKDREQELYKLLNILSQASLVEYQPLNGDIPTNNDTQPKE